MSGSASDAPASAVPERDRSPNDRDDLVPLEESPDDAHGTRMAYQSGTRVPLYVVGAWVVFTIAYVVYQLVYLVPDLRAWFRALL
jgi:hypothetical protein